MIEKQWVLPNLSILVGLDLREAKAHGRFRKRQYRRADLEGRYKFRGPREVIQHLSGEYPLQEAVQKIRTRTRQLAKRQGTWFRSLQECRRVEQTDEREPKQVAEEILAAAGG